MKIAKKTISIFLLSFTFVCTVTLSNSIVKNININESLNIQISELNKEFIIEQEELTELQREKDTMDSNAYIEKIAREKLGMVKPDEIVFKQK